MSCDNLSFPATAEVRAFEPVDLNLIVTEATMVNNIITLEETEIPVDISDTILYLDHEEGVFTWEVSFDNGETWVEAGKSKNQFYVTWDKPLYKEKDKKFPLKHTFLHIGTTGGNTVGGKEPVKVIQAIFDEANGSTVKITNHITGGEKWEPAEKKIEVCIPNISKRNNIADASK